MYLCPKPQPSHTMTIYQALSILDNHADEERKLFFTNCRIDGRFDCERVRNSYRSSRCFDPCTDDDGLIFSTATKYDYKNIVIVDEEGNVVAKDAFTPTPEEREECARYYQCDFYGLKDNKDIPFVRRRKTKDLLEMIADKIDEYIVRKKLRVCDPDEDVYGQCISTFMLADALADDPVLQARAAKLTKNKLIDLAAKFMERTIWIDEEAGVDYADVFMLNLYKTKEGIRAEIWDGYP